MEQVTMRQVVAGNVRRLRENRLSFSQAQFGRRIGEVTGRAWTGAAVSAMERGERPFTANDLAVLALALRVLPGALLLADPEQIDTIVLEGTDEAKAVPVSSLQMMGATDDPDGVDNRLRELHTSGEDAAQQAIAHQQALQKALFALQDAYNGATPLADAASDTANLIAGLRRESLRFAQGSGTTVSGKTDSQEE